MIGWELIGSWKAEQPQRCRVCHEEYVGRDLGYLPNMCEVEDCPGPPERVHVTVEPVRRAAP